MSMEVSVVVAIADGDAAGNRYVHVARVESVIPTAARDVDADVENATDMVDLARATLDRLAAEALQTAGEQIGQLRDVIQGLAT